MRRTFSVGFVLFAWACGDSGVERPADAAVALDASSPSDSGVLDAGPLDGNSSVDAGGCEEGCGFAEVALGFVTSCARRTNGEVWCWGHNLNGEVGDGRERHPGADCTRMVDVQVQDCPSPVRVVGIGEAVRLSSRGARNACALNSDEEVWCWGLEVIADTEGEQRERRFTPVRIRGFDEATDISTGSGHTCAVLGGSVSCYGSNDSGELGNGDRMERRAADMPTRVSGIPDTVIDVEVSALDARGGIDDFACAHSGSSLWCWGSNQSGQLGGALTTEQCMPDLTTQYACSSVALEVPLPVGVSIAQLTLGARHACFVSGEGEVFCWGENALGQLGTGDTTPQSTPTQVVGIGSAIEVTAGFRHTCARLADGTLRCWGGNEDGPLGDGSFDHSMSCVSQGDVVDCSPSPVMVETIGDAVSLAAGFEHNCAARVAGDVWCWGWNDRRGLGDGMEERRAAPVRVVGLGD